LNYQIDFVLLLYLCTIDHLVKNKALIRVYIFITATLTALSAFLYFDDKDLDIMPIILEVKNHEKPARIPETFAEDSTKFASQGKLIYNADTSFSFQYSKSTKQAHPFTGLFFPLEKLNIDFSKYDAIEVGIKTKKARRIPFNLSVQNKKDTHQYIRQFLEIKKNQSIYTLRLDEFFTPTSWYDRNNVAQIDIPNPDLSKIEALSFESCHLLENGVQDEFEIYQLILQKDKNWIYVISISFIVITTIFIWLLVFSPFRKEKEIIHIPMKQVETNAEDDIESRIIIFLGDNYTNPNLTLNDLTKEFGISSREMSTIIKNKTEMAFPKYINFMRVEEAKRILLSKEYKTISEVGYAVGFNSPSNFNRVFKTIVGSSPKQFNEPNA
jgi:AraC-like DNA-binding protein